MARTSCCRQRNNWLVWIPAARATSEATAPGSIAAATIRSFSARDHRRRRCTDVITSTAFVIGLVLVLVLGLAARTHPRKAAFTGLQLPTISASSVAAAIGGMLNSKETLVIHC